MGVIVFFVGLSLALITVLLNLKRQNDAVDAYHRSLFYKWVSMVGVVLGAEK